MKWRVEPNAALATQMFDVSEKPCLVLTIGDYDRARDTVGYFVRPHLDLGRQLTRAVIVCIE